MSSLVNGRAVTLANGLHLTLPVAAVGFEAALAWQPARGLSFSGIAHLAGRLLIAAGRP
jgi:hypothetical protein